MRFWFYIIIYIKRLIIFLFRIINLEVAVENWEISIPTYWLDSQGRKNYIVMFRNKRSKAKVSTVYFSIGSI